MTAGRPPGGTTHIVQLDGSVEQKHRLRVILDVISGQMSLKQACEVLHLSEARVHELRARALQAALDGLAPAVAGRPRTQQPDDNTNRELQAKVRELELELQAALVRTELALAMPQLLADARHGRKKNRRRPPS